MNRYDNSDERPETNLGMRNIGEILQAPHIFGTKQNGITPVVLVPSNSLSMTVSIPHGCAAIVTRYGKSLGVYSPGFYCFPPFYSIAYLVNTQHIPYHFHIKECPTRDNVQIKIHVDLLFQITEPSAFVYDIGPEKFEELIRATQAESVRSLVRSIKVHEAYDLRGTESEDMVKSLNTKLSPYGVKVEFVTITNVTLPEQIAASLQSETTFESKQTEQRKKQEYELKVLNDNNAKMKVKQDRDNERKKATEEAKRSRTRITQEIQQLEAQVERTLAEIVAAQNFEVQKILADGRVINTKLQAEKDKAILEINAKTKSEVKKVTAEAQKYVTEISSGAKIVVADNDAKALQADGSAEDTAATKLQTRRKFEIELENAKMWSSLASNSAVLITGDEGNNNYMAQIFNATQFEKIAKKA